MRTSASFNPDDAIGGECRVIHQELRIFFGVDVVGNHRDVVRVTKPATKLKRQRGFTGTDWAANTYA